MTDHKSILMEAQGLVHGDRQRDYGHPADDFARTAALASIVLGKSLTASDVAAFLVCVKLSRQVNRPKRDNLVDLAGYAETWQMVLDQQGADPKEMEALARTRANRPESLGERLTKLHALDATKLSPSP